MASLGSAEKMLLSTSLNSCQQNSMFTASLFNVIYTPLNGSAEIQLVATSSVQAKVVFQLAISVYGYEFLRQTVNPCDLHLPGLCPMVPGKMNAPFNIPVPKEAAEKIPGIAYGIPDLDAVVRVHVNLTSTGESIACMEANISNGKSVNVDGVKWATAIVTALVLASSAVISGLGHFNAAAHIAANSLSVFSYFQAQAIVGLNGVPLPPIAQGWTQNFQWAMGIIRVGFMQDIFTWYQRATGGAPSLIFDSLTTVSVQVQKRSLGLAESARDHLKRGMGIFLRTAMKRSNITTGSGSYVVFGIQRAAFRAGIETTNLFMTGLVFFCILVAVIVLSVAAFKGICELVVKRKWMNDSRFIDFRGNWLVVLKGILYRIYLIGFPLGVILCLWEFTQVDSAAEVFLAVIWLLGMCSTLGWGVFQIIQLARRSFALHGNLAYILYSDPRVFNHWGPLYVQFRASSYYFIAPTLGYYFIKGALVAFGQRNSTAQAVGFVFVESIALAAGSILRPWMDKSTNSFNIAICVVNLLNAIFLLIFSNVFGAPMLAIGVAGVVFFVLNAAFSLALLLMVMISTLFTFFRENPDARYQYMADDRTSFLQSQARLTTTAELDALSATARGDGARSKTEPLLEDNNGLLHSNGIGSTPREPPNGSNISVLRSLNMPHRGDSSLPVMSSSTYKAPRQ
ncbi:Putative flavin carrier protein 3 [Tolypocladium paradoxum]|uniref:Flavin carrier protein 3 n=1 Tax=Tolypocladium paradoxum TaxID=94208 RepID=A0A2S4LAP9_9HYPO|nr:Putative flavin carrier protein 3 [Tolypocladium paradoxum]